MPDPPLIKTQPMASAPSGSIDYRDAHGVSITSATVLLGDHTFRTSDIVGARLVREPQGCYQAFTEVVAWCLFGASLLTTLVSLASGKGGVACALPSVGFTVATVIAIGYTRRTQVRQTRLKVKTAYGEVDTLCTDDTSYLRHVLSALNQAIGLGRREQT